VRSYRPRYTPEVAGRIRKLHPEVKQEIRTAIRTLLSTPFLGRELQFELSGYHSYRVRTYRIIYRINDDDAMLDIVFIGPRRTVYEELKALLKERE
jgi:mRNA-degrading endonuclease RelE of RelBE toxin-antitoxin system